MGRFRDWQRRHDDNLTGRYGRLPGPLKSVTDLYPSQQRVKARDQVEHQTPPPPPVQPTPTVPPPGYQQASVADELERLSGLYQQGVLSADEFAAAKARLLSS